MDILNVIAELREACARIDDAIASLEEVVVTTNSAQRPTPGMEQPVRSFCVSEPECQNEGGRRPAPAHGLSALSWRWC
jgi:hypothetical protein